MEKIEFVKLETGKQITGTFKSFGKNQYGIYMVLKQNKKFVAVNIKNAVLKNLIKTNLDKFTDGVEVKIEKGNAVKNKRYVMFYLYINNELQSSQSNDIDINEVRNLLWT